MSARRVASEHGVDMCESHRVLDPGEDTRFAN
jgi:hypothetical protein